MFLHCDESEFSFDPNLKRSEKKLDVNNSSLQIPIMNACLYKGSEEYYLKEVYLALQNLADNKYNSDNSIIDKLINAYDKGFRKIWIKSNVNIELENALQSYTFLYNKPYKEIVSWWQGYGKNNKRDTWARNAIDEIINKNEWDETARKQIFKITRIYRVIHIMTKSDFVKYWDSIKDKSRKEWATDELHWALSNYNNKNQAILRAAKEYIYYYSFSLKTLHKLNIPILTKDGTQIPDEHKLNEEHIKQIMEFIKDTDYSPLDKNYEDFLLIFE